MPPVISNNQNLLGFGQYQRWHFLPYAEGLDNTTPLQWRTSKNFDRRLPDVVVARMTALPSCTYNNGTAGVGATLTATANGALGAVDGRTLYPGDNIMVGAEAAAANNGIYMVTDPGATGSPWILTRHADMDAAAEFVGHVLVLDGTTYGGKIYLAPPWPVTVGSSPVTWAVWPNRAVAVTTVPEGVTLNIATGVLDGAATVVGSGEVGIKMSADSGATWSDVARVVYGIEARNAPARSGFDLTINLDDNTVQVPGGFLPFAYNDQKLVRVRFQKSGQAVDLGDLDFLMIGLRGRDDEMAVVLGGGASGDGKTPPWFGRDAGDEPVYLMYLNPTGDPLMEAIQAAWRPRSATPNYAELDVQVRWGEVNTTGIGEGVLRNTALPFLARAYAEIVEEEV